MATSLHQLNLSPAETNDETAMAIALRAGGVTTPGEKLAALALEACRVFKLRGGQRKHIADALRGELTFALIEQWRPAALGEAIGTLLDKAQAKIDADAPEKPQRAAAAATSAVERKDTQSSMSDEPVELKMPTPILSWDRDGKFANDEARSAKFASAIARTAVRLSKLDDFYINGRPIGDVTPDEADSWAAGKERDARFVRMLTAGLPRGLSKAIREYRTTEESDTLFAQATTARLKH